MNRPSHSRALALIVALALAGFAARCTAEESRPADRHKPAMVYDSARDRVVAFGGLRGATGFADVWERPARAVGEWRRVLPHGEGPVGRFGHTAIYDPIRDRILVFGGSSPGGGSFDDVWELLLSHGPAWRRMVPTGVPPASRFGHTAVYDPGRHRMIVFGGFGERFERDVWTLSLGTLPSWSRLYPSGELPAGRNAHAAIFDPGRQRMVVHGGFDGDASRDDTWILQLAKRLSWERLAPPPAAPGRRQHAAVYDPVRDRMLIFGGTVDGSDSGFSDVRFLELADGSWHASNPAGSAPAPRWGLAMAYATRTDGVVVFAGVNKDRWWSDTHWLELTPSPRWVNGDSAQP